MVNLTDPADERSATARQVPWTRAERTREIGYAQAMFEMGRFARELKEGFRPGPIPECAALPPEAAYALGVGIAAGLIDRIARYAHDAYLMYADPALFGKDVSRVDGDFYGIAPAEPGAGTPEESGTGGAP